LALANIFEERATCSENLTVDFFATEALARLSNLTAAVSFSIGTPLIAIAITNSFQMLLQNYEYFPQYTNQSLLLLVISPNMAAKL